MMCERTTLSKGTYLRIEKGDPKMALGAYAMVIFVLPIGNGMPLGDLVDASGDELGLMLDEERLPKRVRFKRAAE